MSGLKQIWRVACYEWFDALRSRRALVVLLLYMTAAVCNMYWSINLLRKMERELVTMLQLPPSEHTGVISTTLWKSKPFQRIAITGCFVVSILLRHFTADTGWRAYLPYLGVLVPEDHKMYMWRSARAPLVTGTVYLMTLGFCYLLAGYAIFRRRDV